MKARLVVLAALAASCAACSGGDPESFRRSWKRVELPGFSVVIPTGKVVHTSSEPWTGKHQVKLDGSALDHWLHDIVINGNVAVSWSAESYSRDDWQQQFLPALVAGLKAAMPDARVLKESSIDEGRWFAVVGNDRAPVAFGVVQCSEDFQVNITYAHYHDATRQVADLLEVMSSVRCEAGAQPRARPMASTRLPAQFAPVEDADGMQIYQSTDGESVAINFTQGDVQRDENMYLAIMRPLLAQSYGVDASSLTMSLVEDGGTPATIIRVVKAGGETSYVGALYCDSVKQSVLSFWSAPNVSDARAIERINQVGCP